MTAWLAFGADISGVWTAQVPGRGGDPQETTFNFKVSGDQLTGSVVTSRGERPIENGKVVGDDVSFTQTMEFGGNQVKLLFKGKVSGSEIKFTRQVADYLASYRTACWSSGRTQMLRNLTGLS